MAHDLIPYFHNSKGIAQIDIGAKKFMCVGALPPFDHPHIFLEIGASNQVTCPYCSTNYIFNSKLDANSSDPISAVFKAKVA